MKIDNDSSFIDDVRLSQQLAAAENIDEVVHELGVIEVKGARYQRRPHDTRRWHSAEFIDFYYEVDPKRSYGRGDLYGVLQQMPGIVIYRGKKGVDIKIWGLNKEMADHRNPTMVLNGTKMSFDLIESLPAELIERIEVLKGTSATLYSKDGALTGVIAVFTRKHDATYKGDFEGLRLTYLGYNQTKEFYSPDYDQPNTDYYQSDYRNTLYWNPSVTTDKEGKATVSFYTSDDKTEYIIHCEGRTAEGLIGTVLCELP